MLCSNALYLRRSNEDLLLLTDSGDVPICTLPLANIRDNLTPAALDAAKVRALDLDLIAEKYAADPVAQISLVFRRAALKRRFHVEGDNISAAEKYYAEFDDGIADPSSVAAHHAKLQYWADRLSEQRNREDEESDEYNLRFCVLNEARASVHSKSRAYILSNLSKGTLPLNTEVLEIIGFNSFYGEAFQIETVERLFSDETLRTGLSPLEVVLFRKDRSLLSFDPKTSEAFWAERDKEIDALLSYISTHDYDQPIAKLEHMTMIDQSLRKFWNMPPVNSHFESQEEFENFRVGVFERVGRVDDFNTAQLKLMLEGRGWFRDDLDGQGAGRAAWLIAQHADQDPEFQQVALKLIKAELGAPGVSKSNYAYLYDRVQMRFGDDNPPEDRIQRYGTQGRCTGPGTWEPLPMEDPENIDARRER